MKKPLYAKFYKVSTDIDNQNVWKECFSVSGVKLPTHYFFGFSAATGDLADNHDIFSVKVYQLESDRKNENIDHSSIVPLAETFSEPREHHDDEHPSKVWTIFKWIFIVIFVIAAILIVIGGGFWFLNRQRNNKKRFY